MCGLGDFAEIWNRPSARVTHPEIGADGPPRLKSGVRHLQDRTSDGAGDLIAVN